MPTAWPANTPQSYNASTVSGGEVITVTLHELGQAGPLSFLFTDDTLIVPDEITIRYEGNVVFQVGSLAPTARSRRLYSFPRVPQRRLRSPWLDLSEQHGTTR